jgi:vacuolar-type H+-ATPase subunit I/STV1
LAIVLGISYAGYRQWLRYQTRKLEARGTTDEIQETLDRLRKQQDALERRMQNIEMIVTSEAWDEADRTDRGADRASSTAAASEAPPETDSGELDVESLGDDAGSAADQVERIARRLRS